MKLLRMDKVLEMTGVSRATVYRLMEKGEFPSSVSIGPRAMGWTEESITKWFEEKIKSTNKKQVKK